MPAPEGSKLLAVAGVAVAALLGAVPFPGPGGPTAGNPGAAPAEPGAHLARSRWQRQDVESYRMARSLALRGQAAEALELLRGELERGFDASVVMDDPAWSGLRRDARFKALMRAHPRSGVAVIAPQGEPGDRLQLALELVDAAGSPVTGALVYAYQTDAEGLYSPGDNDNRNPRLYAYGRADDAGHVVLHTIRPASYPGARVPQHVHLEIEARGFAALATEVQFDDDPLLDAEQRAGSERRGWPIVAVAGGTPALASARITLVAIRRQPSMGRSATGRVAPPERPARTPRPPSGRPAATGGHLLRWDDEGTAQGGSVGF